MRESEWQEVRELRAELRAERDKALEQVEALLEIAEEHRAEKAHGRTAKMDHFDACLYATADRIRSEQDKGLKDG